MTPDEGPCGCPQSEALKAEVERLRAVLVRIVGQPEPNRWGYDAAGVALDDEWRKDALKALAFAPEPVE